MRSQEDFQNDIITDVFRKSNIPYFPVDISAPAKGYLEDAIAKKINSRDDLIKALDSQPKQNEPSMEKEYMIAIGQSLQAEIEEHQREVNYSIRKLDSYGNSESCPRN